MSTASDGRNIATTKSGHKVVTGPEISNNPAVPPAGPVPGPYVIAAQSSTAKTTGAKLIVKGGEALTVESVMDADRPANQPSQPTGGDVVTFAVVGEVPVTSGTGTCTVSGKDVARTGDTCATNTISPPAEMAQMTGILVGAAWTGTGGSDKSGDGSGDGSGATAKPAQGADTPAPPGTESAPENACEDGHPVAVQSGFVVDREPELELPGAIALSVWRHYSSQRHREDGLLGRGVGACRSISGYVPRKRLSKCGSKTAGAPISSPSDRVSRGSTAARGWSCSPMRCQDAGSATACSTSAGAFGATTARRLPVAQRGW